MVSVRGQKKLGPRPDRSPLIKGFNSKFLTSIPTAFICGVPRGIRDKGSNNNVVCLSG